MVRVSVLIPTRNRPAMAELAVRYALDAAGPDDEVIVAENSDEPPRFDFGDARLRVLQADRVYSMPDNWERAIGAARGEDVILVSDRQRLVQGSVARLRAARRRADDVVLSAYAWFTQNVSPRDADRPGGIVEAPGRLDFSRPAGARERSSRAALRDWFVSLRYSTERPMLYNSMIPRRIIDSVVRRHGRFFFGTAPDVCSGMHILVATDTYIESGITAIVNHMPSRDTRWSNGASFSAGTAVGKDFIRQFGGSPLGGLPELNASVIYQTMLEFTRLNPGYVPDDWLRIERFAREAAAEIQLAKRSDRLRMQASVLIATQRGGIHARALLAQARSIAVSFASPGLRSYVRARLSKPRLEGPMLQVPMPSLTEAMRRVAQEQIKISAPPIHGADPGTAQLD